MDYLVNNGSFHVNNLFNLSTWEVRGGGVNGTIIPLNNQWMGALSPPNKNIIKLLRETTTNYGMCLTDWIIINSTTNFYGNYKLHDLGAYLNFPWYNIDNGGKNRTN